MADVTNAPVPTGASEFDIPGDLAALADHFGAPEHYAVTDPASLPAAALNWPGRQVWVRSDKTLRVWDADTLQWLTAADAIGSAWTVATPESAFYNIVTFGDDRALSTRKIGKGVRIEGHISTDGGTAAGSIWAYIAAGHRPEKNAWVWASVDGSGTGILRAFVNASGALTFATGVGSAQSVIVSGFYYTA